MRKFISLLTIFFIAGVHHSFAADNKSKVSSFVKAFNVSARIQGFTTDPDMVSELIRQKKLKKHAFKFVEIVKNDQPVVFNMGSNNGKENEIPVHKVKLTKPFEMQKTEVTQFQYKLIMGGSLPSYFQPDDDDAPTYNRPVESVNYQDAQEFIATLNSLDNEYVYRLPTEAEWEYAAGLEPSPKTLEQYAWYECNSERRTHDVALKLANKFGLYDMFGNVSEIVNDRYSTTANNEDVAPKCADNGDEGYDHVVRGINWKNHEDKRGNLGASDIVSTSDGFSYVWGCETSYVGFRLVRTPKKN